VPLPCVRFTVRRMMVAVAIVAALSAALAIPYRRARFAALREYHGHRLASRALHTPESLTFYNDLGEPLYRYGSHGATPDQARHQEAMQRYHARMIETYDRAARYPFLPVAPDPPEPE
jgi:hypothetical protein